MENENTSIDRSVKDLGADGREWLEQLLGRPLSDEQHVYIMTYTPNVETFDATRRKAMEKIERTFAKVDKHVKAKGVTAEEIDEAIDEAMEHVRRRKN